MIILLYFNISAKGLYQEKHVSINYIVTIIIHNLEDKTIFCI